MKEFKGTKGTWSMGIPGTVVSDSGDSTPKNTGHADTEYYGGYLVCESIASKADAQLIATAPELLEELKHCVEALRVVKAKPIVERAEKVINKALGEQL